jgi:hypothetical protein
MLPLLRITLLFWSTSSTFLSDAELKFTVFIVPYVDEFMKYGILSPLNILLFRHMPVLIPVHFIEAFYYSFATIFLAAESLTRNKLLFFTSSLSSFTNITGKQDWQKSHQLEF